MMLGMFALVAVTPPTYSSHTPTKAVGTALPSMSLLTLKGHSITLGRYRGHWIYLDFFATWCGPCNQEMPTIERDAAAYGKRVTFIGLDEREPAARVRAFLRRYPTAFAHVLIDPPVLGLDPTSWQYNVYGPQGPFGALQASYESSMLPGGILVDPKGIVRAVWSGYLGTDELALHLRALHISKEYPTSARGAASANLSQANRDRRKPRCNAHRSGDLKLARFRGGFWVRHQAA